MHQYDIITRIIWLANACAVFRLVEMFSLSHSHLCFERGLVLSGASLPKRFSGAWLYWILSSVTSVDCFRIGSELNMSYLKLSVLIVLYFLCENYLSRCGGITV